MSTHISQELLASGVAQVIVVLHPAAATSAASIKGLHKYFTRSELSRSSALALASGRAKPGRGARHLRGAAAAPQFYANLGIIYGAVDRAGLAGLQAQKKKVASVQGAPQLSFIRPVRVSDAKLRRHITWGIQALGVPNLWKRGLTGKGVVVGHLDTGVDGRHAALRNAIAAFAEFDDLGHPVTPAPHPHDTDEHGTHTAGSIAGREVNGKAFGVAPGADLASAIVIEGGDTVARVLAGMDWALGQGVRILSMSLGFRGFFEDFLPLTEILRSRNVLPVFAVGNEGPGTSRSPGNYGEVLSVGAVDAKGNVPDFSSSQKFNRKQDAIVPDLIAPGVNVISAKPGGGVQSMDGTSMATPHIAGLAALLFEAKPDAAIDLVETALFRSCELTADQIVTRANRGMPKGPRALEILESLHA